MGNNGQTQKHTEQLDISIYVLLFTLLDQAGWSCAEFVEKTQLSRNTYYMIKRKEKHIYTKRIIVTLAIAFCLPYSMSEVLLFSAGYRLTSSKIDRAYFDLLNLCLGVEKSNQVLEDEGIEEKHWLGSAPRQF